MEPGAEASGGDATGDTLRSIENVTGSAHDDRLNGDSGANVLAGGAGSGHGRDTFVFNTGDGADVVTDNDSGWQFLWWHIPGDTIQLGVEGIDDFDDLLAAANQTGRDVTLNVGKDDSLTLQTTHLSTLDQDGFVFV